jgi:hypothetical protein
MHAGHAVCLSKRKQTISTGGIIFILLPGTSKKQPKSQENTSKKIST